jgi:hypothetical protein
MRSVFVTYTRALTIYPADAAYYGDTITAELDRHGRVVSLVGVSFGVDVIADGEQVLAHSWPPPNVRYVSTDQDVLATIRASWRPGQTVDVRAWCIGGDGIRVEASESFVVPEPPPAPDIEEPEWTL